MLKRKVLDYVKLVLAIDPAIDVEKSNFDLYYETWDLKHIIIKEGEKPTCFTIRQISDKARDKLLSITNSPERATMAIRCGLVDVENYFIEKPNGELIPLESPKRSNYGDWGNIITDEWMETAKFCFDEKLAIGGAVITITEARPPLS